MKKNFTALSGPARNAAPSFSRRNGFSLVELSVALVIIGLLVAAVSAGGSLLRSMKLKSMAADAKNFKGSLVNFASVYQGLPGDLINASSYFDKTKLPSPGKGTCDYGKLTAFNGNGDDKIGGGNGAARNTEPALALLHLTLSEITKQSYCGVWDNAFIPGVNVASSKLDKGAAMQITCCGDTDYNRGITMKNHFDFFMVMPGDAGKKEGVVSPFEARQIDRKLDDGNPDAGFVAAAGKYSGGAYSGAGCYENERDSAKYITAPTTRDDRTACRMLFAYD